MRGERKPSGAALELPHVVKRCQTACGLRPTGREPRFGATVIDIFGYQEGVKQHFRQLRPASLTASWIACFGEPFLIGLGHVASVKRAGWSFAVGPSTAVATIDPFGAASCIRVDFTPARRPSVLQTADTQSTQYSAKWRRNAMSATPNPQNQTTTKLILSALKSLVVGLVILGLLLFLPAGTLDYWQAWVLIAVFVLGSQAIGIYLSVHDPELLERRKQAGPQAETRPAQKLIISVLIVAIVAALVLSALDHRIGWSTIPAPLSLAGDVLVAIGLYITFLVVKGNSFSAANIKVFKDQKVISTGPYAIVRHPMYSGTLLFTLASPLALGSLWGFVPILLVIPMLVWRILDEEKLLNAELPGYLDYANRLRYRLVPCVW